MTRKSGRRWRAWSCKARRSSAVSSSKRSATIAARTRQADHRSGQDRGSAAGRCGADVGEVGRQVALPALAGLQRTAPREAQPSIAAAICLLGVNCASHQPYIVDSLAFSIKNLGFQELVRSSAAALGVLAVAGHEDALVEFVKQGTPTRDPDPRADRARDRHRRAAQRALTTKVLGRRRCASRGSTCCAKRSTCSRKISRRSASSRPSAAATGRPPAGSPARVVAQIRSIREAGVLIADLRRHSTFHIQHCLHGLQGFRRRHRCRQRGRAPDSLARARHVHAWRLVRDRIVWRTLPRSARRASTTRCSSRAPTASAPSFASRS